MTYEQYTSRSNGHSNGQSNGHALTQTPDNASALQRDAADIRQEMGQTIDAISRQLQPTELLKRAIDTFAGSSDQRARFMDNVGRSVSENPIPLALIAAGFGYMVYSDGQRRREAAAPPSPGSQSPAYATQNPHAPDAYSAMLNGNAPYAHDPRIAPPSPHGQEGESASEEAGGSDSVSRTRQSLADAADSARERMRNAAAAADARVATWTERARAGAEGTAASVSDLSERARSGATDLGSRAWAGASDLGSRAREGTSALSERAREGRDHAAERASELARAAQQSARQAAQRGGQFAQEQPLVMSGLGFALGAALAGMTPMSERETDLMGQPADRALQTLEKGASAVGQRATEIGKAVAHAGGPDLGDAAERASGELQALGNLVGAAATKASAAARDELRSDIERLGSGDATESGNQDAGDGYDRFAHASTQPPADPAGGTHATGDGSAPAASKTFPRVGEG